MICSKAQCRYGLLEQQRMTAANVAGGVSFTAPLQPIAAGPILLKKQEAKRDSA